MSDQPWRIRTELIQGPPGPVGTFLRTIQAWTPTTVASGGNQSTTVTVNGATVGMVVWAASNVALTPGAFLSAQVTAPNTITVTLVNLTGAGYTPGAIVLTVEVSQN